MLSPEQVAEDMALTLYALEEGYGGRNHLPGDSFGSGIRALKKIRGSLSPVELKDHIDSILNRIPDNHLKARLGGDPSPERKKAGLQRNVGANAISNPKRKWEVRLDQFNGKNVLYISITSFPSHKDQGWKGFLDQVKSHFANTAAAVLDFRSNGGGDDTMGYALAKLMYGGEYNHPLNTSYLSQVPETFILGANNFRLHQIRMREEGESPPAYFDELHEEYFQKYRKALNGEMDRQAVIVEEIRDLKFNPQLGYDKPIFILLNGACASSCESTTDAFEPHPLVKKVGAPTAGMIHFGNVGALLLPHSKVQVQIPTKANAYFDQRFIEKRGIQPDCLIPDGQDAYQFVKERLL